MDVKDWGYELEVLRCLPSVVMVSDAPRLPTSIALTLKDLPLSLLCRNLRPEHRSLAY